MSNVIVAALLLSVGAWAAVLIVRGPKNNKEASSSGSPPKARIDRKEMAYASAIILAVIVAGLFANSSYRFKSVENPDEIFAKQALQSARNAMLDPTAVKFKNVTVNRNASCMYGQILAKNALGAYTGYRDFVWINRRTFVSYADQASPLSAAKDINVLADYFEAHGKCLEAKIDRNNLPYNIPEA